MGPLPPIPEDEESAAGSGAGTSEMGQDEAPTTGVRRPSDTELLVPPARRQRHDSSSVSEPASEPSIPPSQLSSALPDPREDERTLVEAARQATAESMARDHPPPPPGGWMRAESTQSNRVRPYFSECLYVNVQEVLPDGYSTFEEAVLAKPETMHNLFSEKAHANECCIAVEESSHKLMVMLQAKDASVVEYRHLNAKDQKLFDAARQKELKGLFDLSLIHI